MRAVVRPAPLQADGLPRVQQWQLVQRVTKQTPEPQQLSRPAQALLLLLLLTQKMRPLADYLPELRSGRQY